MDAERYHERRDGQQPPTPTSPKAAPMWKPSRPQ